MSKAVKIVSRVAMGFIIIGAISIPFMMRGLKTIQALTISDIDISSIADGEYLGEYKKARWDYTVSVTVHDGAITDIRVLNKKMQPFKKINDALTRRIIEQKKNNVDVYTGATVTSKAFLKAVENALRK